MRVLLLALDGDEKRARTILQSTYTDPTIETVARARIESARLAERVKLVRALRPDVFAVSMQNLDWQRGQTLLALLGGASGAKEVVALDSTGRLHSERRTKVIFRAPFRLLREAWMSFSAILTSYRQLAQLEKAVKRLGAHASPRADECAARTPELEASSRLPALICTRGRVRSQGNPEFVFLRATPGPGTQAGGASSHITGLINAAKTQGAHVSVISNDHIAGLDLMNVPFTLVPLEAAGITRPAFDLRNNLIFTAGALKAISRHPPDFIYQRYSRFTWAGVTASLLFKRPLFLEYNGSEVWVGKHWDDAGMFDLLEKFERLNLNAAARIFVVSEVERQNLLRIGIPDQKIVVNPNGADSEKFRPDIGGRKFRSEVGITEDETLVGFVGTFGPWHGVLELAKAIKLFPRDSKLRFLLVGTGKLRSATEQAVRDACLSDRVLFTGTVPHERVPLLLDACEILVAPHVPLGDGSDFFGSPTKLFEYMAMGKGIVASRLGQIADVLVNEETALLVEPGNVIELSAAIARLAAEPELRTRLGENARRVVVEKYTWQHNARRVLEAYCSWAKDTANS